MTGLSRCGAVVTLALLTAAATAATPRAAAADYRAKYQDLLKSRGAVGVVLPILAAFGGPAAADEIEQLGSVLAALPADASAVVVGPLPAEKSVEAASVAAELLYAMDARIGGRRLADDRDWRPVVEKGAALLGHEDPFVRGVAAWALIAVRDAAVGPFCRKGLERQTDVAGSQVPARQAGGPGTIAACARYAGVDGEMPRAAAGNFRGVRLRVASDGPGHTARCGTSRDRPKHRPSRRGAGGVRAGACERAAAAADGRRPGNPAAGIPSSRRSEASGRPCRSTEMVDGSPPRCPGRCVGRSRHGFQGAGVLQGPGQDRRKSPRRSGAEPRPSEGTAPGRRRLRLIGHRARRPRRVR